ncbi:MAG: toll/interleukin-1 receptor domain-containing protein, partial [Rhodocyclaceae bacterium]|nr:toll/interleukin-1 receptor domain-containing protein [Rhodocyclaceae bacterium]
MTAEIIARLKVFVSYARSDGSALAEELVTALEVAGFEGYLDRHDISAGEDWEQRLDTLIRQADTVVFLITPSAVASERCTWELDLARALAKRIIPVLGLPCAEATIPVDLRRLNFINFAPGNSFARGLGQLVGALRLDLDWIREHTRLGELAQRWEIRERVEALLLR